MVKNITKTKKSYNSANESEIQGYYYYYLVASQNRHVYEYMTKAEMASAHSKGDKYFAKSATNRTEAIWKKSSRNEWYLQTIANSTTNDNLLSLPDYTG